MKVISRLANWGVPLAKPRVALFVASPRADYRAVGFPLRSLTQNAMYVVTMAVFLGCTKSTSLHDVESRTFSIPKIIQTHDTTAIELTPIYHIEAARAIFSGKFQFGDTINLSTRSDSTYEKDLVEEPRITGGGDTMSTDGLQLVADYHAIMRPAVSYLKAESHYPVYIFNESSRSKFLYGKDTHVFAIQEALDVAGSWRPIEGKSFDFCGNGRWGIKIRPSEYVLFSMRRYSGNFRTKLRIRLVNGSATYVSHPFEGEINFKQFLVEPDGYFHEELTRNRVRAISTVFNGSIPLGYDLEPN